MPVLIAAGLVFLVLALVWMPAPLVRAVLMLLVISLLMVGVGAILVRTMGWHSWISVVALPLLWPLGRRFLASMLWGWALRSSPSDTTDTNRGRYDGEAKRQPEEPMDVNKAKRILGLDGSIEPLTPERVQSAYRHLMAGVHPDQGGSTYLAAKLNQARDVLLNICS